MMGSNKFSKFPRRQEKRTITHYALHFPTDRRNEPDARFRCVRLSDGEIQWERPEGWPNGGHSKLARGEPTPCAFKQVEDRAVDAALRLQEEVGLDVVTDGEMRRLSFQSEVASADPGSRPLGAERSGLVRQGARRRAVRRLRSGQSAEAHLSAREDQP